MNIREEFEKVIIELGYVPVWDGDGYLYEEVQVAWQAWQAARESEGGEAVGLRHALQRVDPLSFNSFDELLGEMQRNGITCAPQPDKWIPEGWKLVPVSATRSMQEAGCCVPLRDRQSEAEWMGEIYQSMLDAVPTPPEQKSE